MSIHLLDLDTIHERIMLIDPDLCSHVGMVSDIDAITDGSGEPIAPSVWIFPAGTDVSGPEGLGHGRIITDSVGVACVIDLSCTAESDQIQRMQALRSAVADLLDDWRHTPRWSPLLYLSGQPETRTNQILVWIDIYTTQVGNHG